MELVLDNICNYIHNYFVSEKVKDRFNIVNGELEGASVHLLDGQYYRIVGSVLNDGVYKHPTTDLKDESFEGEVWAMSVPSTVIAIADEVGNWEEQNASKINSPLQSESFGGYSYSKASGKDGKAFSWIDAFGRKLNPWRKLP